MYLSSQYEFDNDLIHFNSYNGILTYLCFQCMIKGGDGINCFIDWLCLSHIPLIYLYGFTWPHTLPASYVPIEYVVRNQGSCFPYSLLCPNVQHSKDCEQKNEEKLTLVTHLVMFLSCQNICHHGFPLDESQIVTITPSSLSPFLVILCGTGVLLISKLM